MATPPTPPTPPTPGKSLSSIKVISDVIVHCGNLRRCLSFSEEFDPGDAADATDATDATDASLIATVYWMIGCGSECYQLGS